MEVGPYGTYDVSTVDDEGSVQASLNGMYRDTNHELLQPNKMDGWWTGSTFTSVCVGGEMRGKSRLA